jgi:hypothetical protein
MTNEREFNTQLSFWDVPEHIRNPWGYPPGGIYTFIIRCCDVKKYLIVGGPGKGQELPSELYPLIRSRDPWV